MAYATIEEFKAYGYTDIAQTVDDDDALLTTLLDVATAEIDAYTHRRFTATTATRRYGRDARIAGKRLYLDEDLLSLTSLTDGYGTAIPVDDCWLEPRNDPPYSIITLKTQYAWLIAPDGEIEVVGSWGTSATPPADIKQACIELTKYLYDLRSQQNADVTAIPEMGQMIIPGGVPKHVKLVLDRHVRRGW